MTPFAPFTEDQFRLMAMCKARAYTWDNIAETVNMPIEVVERVAWTHEKIWHRFLTKAERHIARETIAEVVGVLRQDLRNAEPQQHATLANSLSRLLKQQQEYAPSRPPRRRESIAPTPNPAPVPVVTPTPAAPEPTGKPSLFGALPTMQETASAVLGLVLLVCAFLTSCWNSVPRPTLTPERATIASVIVTHESNVCEAPAQRPTPVVQMPPSWTREPDIVHGTLAT